MDQRKTIEATLNLGTEDKPAPMTFHVKEPTLANRRELNAYEMVWNRDGDGAALTALAEAGLRVLDVPESEIEPHDPSLQLVIGRRLAEWAIRGDRPNS